MFRTSVKSGGINPICTQQKIDQAIDILKQLGFPRRLQNQRSALTLLAFLKLGPDKNWSDAQKRRIGVPYMMKFFEDKYGKKYTPNSRETIQMQTTIQFVKSALVIKHVYLYAGRGMPMQVLYQIEDTALKLLQRFDTKYWQKNLKEYLEKRSSLKQKYPDGIIVHHVYDWCGTGAAELDVYDWCGTGAAELESMHRAYHATKHFSYVFTPT